VSTNGKLPSTITDVEAPRGSGKIRHQRAREVDGLTGIVVSVVTEQVEA
jgi:hypothetical protein